MTDTSAGGQSSSLAQLLALLGGGGQQQPASPFMGPVPQTPNYQAQDQMRQLALMRYMQGGMQGPQGALQAAQTYGVPTGMPGASMPMSGAPMSGGAPQANAGQPPANMMAFLQSLDPATRARLMAQMGVNAAPMGMPASGGAMNADFLGTRG